MRKHHFSGLLVAGLIGLTVAASFSASAVAAAPHSSAQSAYRQLTADFQRMLTVRGSQIKAHELAFEKSSTTCLTQAFTATLVAEAPGSADASAATAAFKPLLYEVAFQMIMQSGKPLITPYVRTLKLAIAVSGLKGAKRAQAVAFEQLFAKAQTLRACADASAWAAAQYAAASEPSGVDLAAELTKAADGSIPNSGKFPGFTSAQTSALKKLVKQTGKRFHAVIQQIDTSGTPWLGRVLIQAQQDAKQQIAATTTNTTPTTTTTTSTTTTG